MITRTALAGFAAFALVLPAHAQDEDGVVAAARKLTDAGSYSFSVRREVNTADDSTARLPGSLTLEIRGLVATGIIHMKAGKLELARKDDKIAVKKGLAWKAPEEQRGSLVERMLQGRMTATLPPDIAILAHLSHFSGVEKKGEKDSNEGTATFRGALTENGSRALLRPVRRGFGAKISGATGNVLIRVDADGVLVGYEMTARGTVSVSAGGVDMTFQVRARMVVEISGIGKAEIALPATAKEILGMGKKDDDKEEGGKEVPSP